MRVLTGVRVGLCALWLVVSAAPAAAQTPAPDPRTVELQREKLEEETRKLRIDNDRNGGWLGWVLAFGPFVTILTGVVTVGIAVRKQAAEVSAERRALLRQQEQDREAREHASAARFDENLSTIVTNLGSDKQALQVNAAAALRTFLKPRYADLHCELLAVVTANLKLRPDPAVADVLRGDLERALRLVLAGPDELRADLGERLDLTYLKLPRIDLRDVDAHGITVDVAFSDLSGANLSGARLDRVRGLRCVLVGARLSGASLVEARLNEVKAKDARFGDAILTSATFRKADLTGADLRRARLQGAHFEGAMLTGARFAEAQLADAYFRGVVVDETAKRSIATGAHRWRDAHFDPHLYAELEDLSNAS